MLAAGPWSRQLGGLPRPLAVEPIRGQMAALAWPTGVPRAIVLGREAYLVAREGEAVVGSTMEHAGFSSEVTAAGLAEIFTRVSALCRRSPGGRCCAPGRGCGRSLRMGFRLSAESPGWMVSGTPPVTAGTAFCSRESPALFWPECWPARTRSSISHHSGRNASGSGEPSASDRGALTRDRALRLGVSVVSPMSKDTARGSLRWCPRRSLPLHASAPDREAYTWHWRRCRPHSSSDGINRCHEPLTSTAPKPPTTGLSCGPFPRG